ncbi:hypothetical protein WMZ97_18430 [Lentibacillus sp. N15]|uniref:hypothetical protein n=1 Tax=Lentibacillus songyuanensis TaxID=3136161 RepID=UPI0031BBA9A1
MINFFCSDSITDSIPAYISAFSAFISAIIAAWSVWQLTQKNNQDKKIKKENQARKISAWLVEGRLGNLIVLQNNSKTPIYNVFLIAVAITGAATGDGEEAIRMNNDAQSDYHMNSNSKKPYRPIYPYLVFKQVPPGRFVKELGFLEGGMNLSFGLEIAFTDSYGNPWKVNRNGNLSKLKDNNYLYTKYFVENPTPWNELNFFKDEIGDL